MTGHRDPDGRCRWCGSSAPHDVTPGEWCPRLAAVAATGCEALQALEGAPRRRVTDWLEYPEPFHADRMPEYLTDQIERLQALEKEARP